MAEKKTKPKKAVFCEECSHWKKRSFFDGWRCEKGHSPRMDWDLGKKKRRCEDFEEE
jgi:hypothetical protein